MAFLDLLCEIAETYHVEIHAFSLMGNHYHLIVHTPEGRLSRAIRHLNGVYTQGANRRRGTDGPIFRGRYKAILLDSDEYLLELIRYIHLNPVKAGICELPREHRWTSHIYYLERSSRPDWLVVDEVLGRFGGNERNAVRAFDRFVSEGMPAAFEETLKEQRVILGSKGFKEWVYKNFVDADKRQEGIPIKDRRVRPNISIKHIIDTVSRVFDIPVKDVRQRQTGIKNDARSMAVYLIRNLNGASQANIAKWLKAPSTQAISQMQNRFRKRMSEDRALKKLVETVTGSIMTTVKP